MQTLQKINAFLLNGRPQVPFKKMLPRILAFAIAVYVGAWIPSKIVVTVTPSVDHRIFWKKENPQPKDIVKGSYVLFDLNSKYFLDGKSVAVVKVVKCTEGETISVKGRDYYCSGEYLGTAKTHTLTGEKLDNFVFNGKIPQGKMFAHGGHKDSFDSRYWGFLDKSNVKAVVYPIL